MRVDAIRFETDFETDGAATSKGSRTKKSQSAESIKPTPLESKQSQNSTQAPVRPVVNGLGLELEFSVDKEIGVTIIKVLDVESGEVVRQIPPEEVLAFMRQFDSKGLLIARRL